MPQLTKPQLLTDCQEVRDAVCEARRAGRSVGLVPTMGALHEGHLSLVRAAKEECDVVVATIFVNPTQFGPNEDLSEYPRTLESDMEALAVLDVDLVFAPSAEAIYPKGFSTHVEPPLVAQMLEGEFRSGHFRGVATVVLKLFNLVPATIAYFGQKDYQQSLVIRRMIKDLDLPIEIRVCPIVREEDGLALSSRNVYLNATERKRALSLYASLRVARQLVEHGEANAAIVRDRMRRVLNDAGITRVDYVAVVDAETLEKLDSIDGRAMALVAAHVGPTRLIDNCEIGWT